jgi:hypothetical protein
MMAQTKNPNFERPSPATPLRYATASGPVIQLRIFKPWNWSHFQARPTSELFNTLEFGSKYYFLGNLAKQSQNRVGFDRKT